MNIEQKNDTVFLGFILLGFSSSLDSQRFLFPIFLCMYLLGLLGNLLIIFLIFSSTNLLHAPMYFFLSQLSLADLGLSSVVVPKLLYNLVTQTKAISHNGCLTQMYFFVSFATTENFILASMAYDRYVAICHPLHYARVMSFKCCLLLAAGSWLLGYSNSLLFTLLISNTIFCASREIPHFFCDVHPLLQITCSDTSIIDNLFVTEAPAIVLVPVFLIVFSYAFIVMKVVKLPSKSRKYKAFSTCSAHLTTVTLFYGTVIGTYIRPSSSYSASRLRVASIFYTVVTPMLNPFIYSLRNSEIHVAVKKLVSNWF